MLLCLVGLVITKTLLPRFKRSCSTWHVPKETKSVTYYFGPWWLESQNIYTVRYGKRMVNFFANDIKTNTFSLLTYYYNTASMMMFSMHRSETTIPVSWRQTLLTCNDLGLKYTRYFCQFWAGPSFAANLPLWRQFHNELLYWSFFTPLLQTS